MTTEEIDATIKGFKLYISGQYRYKCDFCPCDIHEFCVGYLFDKILEALECLKELKTSADEVRSEQDEFKRNELMLELEKTQLPKPGDPNLYEKVGEIRKAELEFKDFMLENGNQNAVRAYNKLETRVPSIKAFALIEKERYLIIDTIGPKVFDYICKKHDQACQQLNFPVIEIDQEKLEKVKYGKTHWPYHERKMFSERMNEIFS